MTAALPWGRIPRSAARTELRALDPEPKDGRLNKSELAALTAEQQARVEELRAELKAKGLLARARTFSKDRAGKSIGVANGRDAADGRTFTDIGTTVSEHNIVEPLFPDSLVAAGPNNYNEAMLRAIREARRFIVLEGYELNREDVVDLLIAKARQGVQVAVVLDPADAPDEATKARLIEKLRAQKLPTLHVAEYAVMAADPGSFEQILHAKKVIADTPSGTIVEVSGGINFNKGSVKNIDSGWRTEGVAVLDSLDHVLAHFEKSNGALPFAHALIPTAAEVIRRCQRRAAREGLELVQVEVGAAGRTEVDKPRDYSPKKLKERAKLGQKLVISSKTVIDPAMSAVLQLAVQNGSEIQIIEERMGARQLAAYKALKPGLREAGAQLLPARAVWKDDSYQKLVYRELDAAIAAKESIDVAAFALSDKKILDRLLAAKSAGCAVRVLVDDLKIDGMMINKKAATLLASADIPVRGLDRKAKERLAAAIGIEPGTLKLHAKIMILGGNRVLGGSANFSKNGLNNNIEDGRLVRCRRVAQAFTNILFEPIWAKASDVEKLELVPDADRVPLLAAVPMQTAIKDAVFLVFDFETTGFVPSHDERILGMSAQAVRVRADGSLEVLGELNRYVTPGHDLFGEEFEIPRVTTHVHGLDKKTLAEKGAVHMRQALPELVGFIHEMQKHGPLIMVGQNVPYDLRFLDHTLARKGLAIERDGKPQHFKIDVPYVDTVDVSWRVFPTEKSHDLDALIARLGIARRADLQRHDAYGDVVYTAQALGKLVAAGGLRTVGDLMGDDMVQFTGPTLLTGADGAAGAQQLEFNEPGKLIVRLRDLATGQFDEGRRVNLVEVLGRSGNRVEIAAVVGRGKNEQRYRGFVDAAKVQFRSPGRVFYELRENGCPLDKPKVICAT